ncbi:ATP12 family chaperone protein [Paracoccus sp. (in: a-proteobacteria)]|uniref:ATP12 family chaperone protein n=1 Tax=Paracoccus sp. TaxID=267 RepID=UPI0026E0C82D|nr:ATP12 family protein [Paracoccus sp. (in: a-proteobacteria)]MDO5370031.1 ATP12 family protein [Paracoccus sp. (in: a-proteobacteria)]
MSEWQARRFWTESAVEPVPGGYEVRLDGRPLRTPGKLPLVLPTRALALAVAAEWDAQVDVIDPGAMPLTRAANSAIERVAPQFDAVADMLAEYGGTDLLCYRAEHPVELVVQQAEGWNPLLDWARSDLQASLQVTQGVIPVAQDPACLSRLRDRLDALSHWELTALHDLVTLSGSLVLGLAVLGRRLQADEAHRLSRIDEEHQAAIWGRDEEADLAAEGRLQALRNAARLLALLAAADAASETDPAPDA